jgi:hypothetical protein
MTRQQLINLCEISRNSTTDIEIIVNEFLSEKNSTLAYKLCVDFWLKDFHPDFTFKAIHGAKLKSIIKQLQTLMKLRGTSVTDESTADTFKTFCAKLPKFYQNKDLSILDSKFNEIIQEIKNVSQTKSITNSKEEAKRILDGV